MFLVKFLKYILELFYSLTNDFGLSIVLLSLAVTIIMLPLFWIGEIIQNKERLRKEKMQPSLDEIKDVKNKQERYYYTKEIYRKYRYSPFYALTGIIGLLIQVPFFLTAYWMLFEYTPLEGESFGPIKDLYQPDGLIAIGGMTFNLLPFVMTLVNLLASYLYSKNQDKTEKIQLIVIALVFLVLLYNLSAALVLYWTLNNVFAIGKNWLMSNMKSENSERFLSKFWLKLKQLLLAPFKKNGYIIYPLLFSIFPLLSIYYTNIGELYFVQIIFLLFIILFSSLLLLIIAKVVFKDQNKVILFGFLVIVLFFSFGHIRELFKEWYIVYDKHRFIGGLYILVLLISSYFLFRTKKNLKKISRILSMLSICLTSIIVIRIAVYKFNVKENNQILGTSEDVLEEKNGDLKNRNAKYPDIYYIVMDGYANSGVLREFHGFDNSNFEAFLKDRGFYIASESRCNYVNTSLSLAATLNMDYITHLKDVLGVETKNTNVLYQMISENKVIKYLKNKGYKTVHFSSGWRITQGNSKSDYNFPKEKSIGEFTTSFLQTTILLPFVNYFSVNNYRDNILYTFDNLDKLDTIKEPKFVFAHMVCPHAPYVFDENGANFSSDIKLDNSWVETDKKYYLQQLEFVNKKIKILVDSLLKKPGKPVIVLQSDHGTAFLGKDWEHPSEAFVKERGKILNAILLNDKSKSLHPKISSVNTFRVVFNNVFNDNFELLKDSTFFSGYDHPYDFKNVTEIIDSQ